MSVSNANQRIHWRQNAVNREFGRPEQPEFLQAYNQSQA